MCDPISIVTAVVGGLGLKQANDRRRDMKRAARRQEARARAEKNEALLDERRERNRTLATNARTDRRYTALSKSALPARSFFARA